MTEFPPSHCPDCGGPLDDSEAPRYYCPACDRTVYHAPVPAARVAVVDGSRILLARRGLPPGEGRWTLPGGHVDLREEPAAAAARELREETRLRVDPADLSLLGAGRLRPLDEVSGRLAQKEVVGLTYAARFADVAGDPEAGSDVDAVRWVDAGDLGDVRTAFARDVDLARRALTDAGNPP